MHDKSYFSYIRVSTARQGTGTSLAEQREAIQRYAERSELKIAQEFEEKETAAKHGRPVFSKMLKELKQGKARGVIIHKIDRSARNLRDWAEVGELIDQGIEVHFANEHLDLYSRGGRLSADIQAVVAADYIRNLKDEVKKGFYGRIKQGLFPMPAPVGYVDCGQGKPKAPHPVQAGLVRKVFELYATGRWSLKPLAEKAYEMVLRNRNGRRMTFQGIAHLLRNLFYIGVIRIERTGETFPGVHEPLVSTTLFNKVQAVMKGKVATRKGRQFLFRKLLRCAECGYKLIAETHKGFIYYRCQKGTCSQKSIREEVVEQSLLGILAELKFSEAENRFFRQEIKVAYQNVTESRELRIAALNLQLDHLRVRLSKLTDTYIDGMVDKELYLEKKNALVLEERATRERLSRVEEDEQKVIGRVEAFLELVNSAYVSYKKADLEEKREMLQIVTSNFSVKDKSVLIKLNSPFQIILDRLNVTDGGAQRIRPRTLSAIFSQLCEYFKEHEFLPRQEIVA